MDGLEIACERVGLDLGEIKAVLGCVRHRLRHFMRPNTPREMLRGAIKRFRVANDCGLCLRVLKGLGHRDAPRPKKLKRFLREYRKAVG